MTCAMYDAEKRRKAAAPKGGRAFGKYVPPAPPPPPMPMRQMPQKRPPMPSVSSVLPAFDPKIPLSMQPEWLALKRQDLAAFEKAKEEDAKAKAKKAKAEAKKAAKAYIDPLIPRDDVAPVCPDLYFFDAKLGLCKTTKRGFQTLGGDRTTKAMCANPDKYYYDKKTMKCKLKRKPEINRKDFSDPNVKLTEAECADFDGYYWDGSTCRELMSPF